MVRGWRRGQDPHLAHFRLDTGRVSWSQASVNSQSRKPLVKSKLHLMIVSTIRHNRAIDVDIQGRGLAGKRASEAPTQGGVSVQNILDDIATWTKIKGWVIGGQKVG